MISSQTPTISSLIKGCKSATVTSDVPEGCGSVVLSPTLTAHLLVKVRAAELSVHGIY
jgi:valyl-tRNA synthetase